MLQQSEIQYINLTFHTGLSYICKITIMERAKDLLTQEEFYKSRSNQKFSSPLNRIRYNNLKARHKRSAKKPVDRPLDMNRTILKRILGDKKEIVVSRDFLLGAGFSFNYFSYHKEVNGVTFAGIYEYGAAQIVKGQYKIVKLNE